jgi:hypothetical protein
MKPPFEIAFTEDCWIDEGTPYRGVRLTLEGWIEEENADLTNWSTKDYEMQWLTELNHIVTSRNKGALITSIHDPALASRICTWTMWKENDQVLFQSRLLFMLERGQDFAPARVSAYIGEYHSHNEDGHRISQWTVPITAIRNFIRERSIALGDPCSTPS